MVPVSGSPADAGIRVEASGAPPPPEPLAVIDLGSNSARVVVVERPVAGVLRAIAGDRLDLRLATAIDARGELDARGMDAALAALAEFTAFAGAAGARSTVAVATAAVRAARNRDALLARARRETGLAIEVLDGAEEARLMAAGALRGLPIRSGVVVDIGGGSTEVARVVGGVIASAWSFPLGALNASAAHLRSDPPAAAELATMRRAAAETIAANAPSRLRPDEQLIGTGGSTRALARLARQDADWPIDRLHGYPLPASVVRGLEGRLAVHTRDERERLDGLRAARADSIVGGAIILDELMRHLGAERLTVAAGGLREGVATRAFGEPVPPPRLVRAAAVEALLRQRGLWRAGDMEARAAHLADGLDADPFGEAHEAARHAAMLRAIGEADGPDGAGGRAADAALGAELAGFGHGMLARVGVILRLGDGDEAGAAPLLAIPAPDEAPVLRAAGALLTP